MSATLALSGSTLNELFVYCDRFIKSVVADGEMCDGYDEFIAYDDKLDVNIHANGEPNVIRAVAHTVKPVQLANCVVYETEMSRFVLVGEWTMDGRVRRP